MEQYKQELSNLLDAFRHVGWVNGLTDLQYDALNHANELLKAAPSAAKAEQEGPWKVRVDHSPGVAETGCSGDEYIVITDGRVELYFDGGIDDDDEQLLCNFLNNLRIKLDYDHEAELYANQMEGLYKETYDEVIRLRKREQEGLRWGKATMFNYKPNSRYYARWGDGDGAIKSTGYFQQSDGTFFWNENGFVPVLKKEHDQLYILDESTTPVKEAGQTQEIDIAKYTLWVFTEVVGWDKADHTFRLHGEIEHRPISDLYPKYLESQNNKP